MVYDDYVAIGIFAKQMGVDAPGIGGAGRIRWWEEDVPSARKGI